MRAAAVIGTGLIGGSLAAALRNCGWFVRGFDVDPAASGEARDRGEIDAVCLDLRESAAGADLVLLSVPVQDTVRLLPVVDALANPEALILDCASVKGPVVAAMAQLPHGERAVGGHPLAGSHRSGPGAAHAELVRGRPFLLCPSTKTSEAALARAESLVKQLGAHPRVLPAEAHDRSLATTSHLPQVLSSLLALQGGDQDLAGQGYRDMTRLAGSNPVMWRDILLSNRDHVLQALKSYGASVSDLADALERRDGDSIETTLMEARMAATA